MYPSNVPSAPQRHKQHCPYFLDLYGSSPYRAERKSRIGEVDQVGPIQ